MEFLLILELCDVLVKRGADQSREAVRQHFDHVIVPSRGSILDSDKAGRATGVSDVVNQAFLGAPT